MKHTPTPWRVEYKHTGTYIFSSDPNFLLLSMSHTRSTKECNDNAVHIVNCVNACEGQLICDVELATAHKNACLVWEHLMMELVGEDGPSSVREAIEKMKQEIVDLKCKIR